MNKPELLDVIELLVDIPKFSLRKGEQGTIIEDYQDGIFEVEFANKKGEATAICSISQDKFIVVWSSKTEQWLTPIPV
ncbi:DUF4926 domain-containing protein [Geminocystis herdmanii]|uniref:DUF4926 domain-containing protein n=1 Tax=Geminocystis herdmanii TaxID=669359 RepID=UPI00034A25AF|nr:DUF4926 domain-containing protein [Geminocystis herdmanii]